jgi:hypothetical protein
MLFLSSFTKLNDHAFEVLLLEIVEKTENGVGVRSTESVKKLFISHRFDFNETPRFPLYGGIKWKTRSLSKNCLFC